MADYHSMSQVIPFSELQDPAEKYILETLLAEGAYGAVYEAVDRWKCKKNLSIIRKIRFGFELPRPITLFFISHSQFTYCSQVGDQNK